MRPPRRPEYPYQVGVGCGKWASSLTQNFLFGPWVYYSRYITLFLNGRYYGVCLPLLSDSSSALSVSCTLVFGDAGCAPEAAQSSQSVGRCVPGIPDQIPGLCCYLGSPAMTMHLGPWSNKRAILTRSWEPCMLLTVMCCDKVRLPLARGFGLTTDLSYSITCWSSFLNYSAISTVTAILLTDHRLMQRKTLWQPVSSSTSQANFCLLLATEALQTNMVLLYAVDGWGYHGSLSP